MSKENLLFDFKNVIGKTGILSKQARLTFETLRKYSFAECMSNIPN